MTTKVSKTKTKTGKTKTKRLPKSQRTYVRRMKQAAHKEGTVYSAPKVRRAPAKIVEK